MAIMIPESCPSKATQGEKDLFALLYERLPDDYHVWYEPITANRYPDFVILGPAFGLLIIEVKGWYGDRIVEASNEQFRVRKGGEGSAIEAHASPIRQSKEYLHRLQNLCKRYEVLVHPEGKHEGKLSFPVGNGVVMSNINLQQAQQPFPGGNTTLFDLLPQPKVAYRDELLAWKELDERQLLQRLRDMFDVYFHFPSLTRDQVQTIHGIVHPEVKVAEIPATSASVPEGQEPPSGNVIVTLDRRQEQLAKSMGDGHRIFFGVAGSGKTLLLLARARLLVDQEPEARILVLTFNKVLAAWLRSQLHTDQINPQYLYIEVCHFHGWARQQLGSLHFLSYRDPPMADRILGERLLAAAQQPGSDKYDAILIDEGHTFAPDWFRACIAFLADPKLGHLLVVCDGNQAMYRRSAFTWSEVGVHARGRTRSKAFHLDVNYRNTQEILDAAWAVLKPVVAASELASGEELGPVTFPLVEPRSLRHGPKPWLWQVQDWNTTLLGLLRHLADDGVAWEQVAVLYRRRTDAFDAILRGLCLHCLEADIPTYWVTESEEHKLNYDPRQPGIRILTTQSALGLDFDTVLLLGLESFAHALASEDAVEERVFARRECYVGMTRARERLHLLYRYPSALTEELTASGAFHTPNEVPNRAGVAVE